MARLRSHTDMDPPIRTAILIVGAAAAPASQRALAGSSERTQGSSHEVRERNTIDLGVVLALAIARAY